MVFATAVVLVSCGGTRSGGTGGTSAAPGATVSGATTAPSTTGGADRATGPGGEPITVARDLPELPPDWPTDVPVADGAGALTVTGFDAASPQDGRSVTYASDRSARDLVAFYTAQLAADGWTVDAEVPTTTGSALSASKTDGDTTRTLFLTVSEAGGRTNVVVAVSG